jgi:hypothetical protein
LAGRQDAGKCRALLSARFGTVADCTAKALQKARLQGRAARLILLLLFDFEHTLDREQAVETRRRSVHIMGSFRHRCDDGIENRFVDADDGGRGVPLE